MSSPSELKAKMEYRYLGNSGLRVSVLSFGAWVNWNTKTEDLAVHASLSSFNMTNNMCRTCSYILYIYILQHMRCVCLQYECTKAALDAGCNFLDNAEVYCAGEAEICMGQVLKRLNVPRSELVISTKVFWGGPGTVFSLPVTSVRDASLIDCVTKTTRATHTTHDTYA